MVKVDLITGFLGSGKTTFIRRYADYLQRQEKKINIIENEFGGVSVDSIILRDQGCDMYVLYRKNILSKYAAGRSRQRIRPDSGGTFGDI